jgi:hypothetical protein
MKSALAKGTVDKQPAKANKAAHFRLLTISSKRSAKRPTQPD